MVEDKKEKPQHKILVVKELPKIDVTSHFDEENNIEYELMTVEQCQAESLELLRRLNKQL